VLLREVLFSLLHHGSATILFEANLIILVGIAKASLKQAFLQVSKV